MQDTQSISTGGKPSSRTLSWQIDPMHSSAHFSVRHMMISNVRGEFKMAGSVLLDPEHAGNSSVEAVIEASSVDTREPARDEHLRSADFLDAKQFPSMTFRSARIEGSPKEGFRMTGDLTIRGVTREVTFEVEPLSQEMTDPYGNVRVGTSAATKLDRRDFGLQWNAVLEAGGVLVGNPVNINLEVELLKPAVDVAE